MLHNIKSTTKWAFALLTLSLMTFSCSSDDDPSPATTEMNNFLSSENLSFSGDIDNSAVNLVYGDNAPQIGNGRKVLEGDEKYLSFMIQSSNQDVTFVIMTPSFNAASEESIPAVLTTGQRSLGGEGGADFYIELVSEGQLYTTAGSQTEGTVEILKSELQQIDGEEKLLVWLSITGNLYATGSDEVISLTNGKVLASFDNEQ